MQMFRRRDERESMDDRRIAQPVLAARLANRPTPASPYLTGAFSGRMSGVHRASRSDIFPAMILVHILRDGAVLVPPFPAPKISRLLHARSILPTDHFWHEGMPD